MAADAMGHTKIPEKRPHKYGAMTKFLGLKRQFDDAVRQNQWKKEAAQRQQGAASSRQSTVTDERRWATALEMARKMGEFDGEIDVIAKAQEIYAAGVGGGNLASGGGEAAAPEAPVNTNNPPSEGYTPPVPTGGQGYWDIIKGGMGAAGPIAPEAGEAIWKAATSPLLKDYNISLTKPLLQKGAITKKAATVTPAKVGKTAGTKDPAIVQRIAELRKAKMSKADIMKFLVEVGIDPSIYGLK